MFTLILENERGDQVPITNTGSYILSEIDGLNPPSAVINTSEGMFDGEKFNSSKMEMRTILISVDINSPAEENRLNFYKVGRPKQYIKLHYKNNTRKVFIEGYVESVKVDYMAMKQNATISILCPEPYFKDAKELIHEINLVLNQFYFAFASEEEPSICFGVIRENLETELINTGEVETGMVITIEAKDETNGIKIFDKFTGEFIGVNFFMRQGDTIIITTNVGNKTVRLFRNGNYTNIFNNLMKNITWLQLKPGINQYAIETGDGKAPEHLELKFEFANKYGGV